jgi:hypothetical protein
MIPLRDVPHGLRAIKARYGDPDVDSDLIGDDTFWNEKLIVRSLPFKMKNSWNDVIVSKVRVHVDVWPSLEDALYEILMQAGERYLAERNFRVDEGVALEDALRVAGEAYLIANGYHVLGGIYNFRQMRGYPALSTHSWGIAIDINPHLAPFKEKPNQPRFIVDIFKARGWDWGGDWYPKYNYDGMHFQACTGY